MGKSTVDASAGFGLRDKLAYAAGDFGCNMSFALKGYLTIYWTQFMGIDNYLMASLLLIVQIWDAINDPIIGAMVDADTHKYRRNKFLAYIWFGAIGLTVAGALCYLPFPQAPSMVKNILFVAGYMIWDAFYTVANVPYGSMLSLISDDPIQRAQLSTFRSIGSMGGALLTGMLIPVIIYDNQNNLRGEQMFVIALIMGVIGLICFRFMVTNTKVRVDTTITLKEDAPKFNIIKAFNNFIHNRPAVGATLAPIATFIGMYGASTAGQILFQAYFKNAKISGIVGMISYFGVFIFSPFVSRIVKRFGKKEAVTFGSVVCALAYVLMLVLPITPDGRGLGLYVLCQVIAMLGGGIGNPPMLPLAQYYQERATVISGFRSAEFVILQEAFQAAGAETILCTDNGTVGRHGLVTEPLQELLQTQQIDAVYACGPKPMLRAIANLANTADVFCEVSLEEIMGCVIGACLVCACKLEREGKPVSAHVCKDGPVFSAKEVVWE